MIRRALIKRTLWRRVLKKKIPSRRPRISESPDKKGSLSDGFLSGINLEQIRESGDDHDQIKSLFGKTSKNT